MTTTDNRPPGEPDDVLTAALGYAARGWYLLPVRGKRPDTGLCPRWAADSTTDPAVLAAWYAGSTGLGIGVDLGRSDLVVVDGDHLDKLDLPPALLTGWQYRGNPARRSWLFSTGGAVVPQAVHPWGEVKSSGGYVVLPPSPHDVGGRYVWRDSEAPDGRPPVLPAELVALLAPPRRDRSPARRPLPAALEPVTTDQRDAAGDILRRQCDAVASTRSGGRNNALNAAAVIVGHYVPHYIDPGTAEAALFTAAERAGLVTDDGRHAVESTVRSGLNAGARDPEALPEAPSQGAPPAVALPTLPAEFWSTSILRHIRDAGHSKQLGGAGMLGAVLARVSLLTSYRVELIGTGANRGSLNMLIGLVAESGGGKGASVNTAGALLPAPEAPCACGEHTQGDFITLPPGSGEGLTRAYYENVKHKDGTKWGRDRHHILFDVDEIESLIAIAGRNGATIGPVIRSLWSGAQAGFQNATAERRFPLDPGTYRTAMVAGVQPAVAGKLFDESMGGTPQRFLWVPAHGRDVPDLGAGEVLPDWPGALPALPRDRITVDTPRIGAHVDPDVLRELELRRNQIARGTLQVGPLDAHRDFMRLRVAALLGRLHNDDRVTAQWWGLAGTLSDLSDATRAVMLEAVGEQARSRSRAAGRADHIRKQGAEDGAAEEAQRDARSIVSVVVRHSEAGPTTRHKGETYNGCPESCVVGGVHRLRGLDDRRARAIRYAIDAGWLVELLTADGPRVAPGESRPA